MYMYFCALYIHGTNIMTCGLKPPHLQVRVFIFNHFKFGVYAEGPVTIDFFCLLIYPLPLEKQLFKK